ncbi:hypothetical protein I0D68_05055 [Pseudomonas lalucatii]|nr:hypothetical protein [Pseudomonas lalucatii]MBS7726235.1 hypothetical protein [Pseudomonas lalucatii]QVM88193.1 hypothetical protein I0D68_05055 [Pseudomonas lalucatii]
MLFDALPLPTPQDLPELLGSLQQIAPCSMPCRTWCSSSRTPRRATCW